MANPHKGEIEFQIGGKTYTHMLGTYGLAKLEQRFKKPWPLILQEGLANWGAEVALACFHCGLLLHHEPISEREASVLLDELTLTTFTEKFGESLRGLFGVPKDGTADPMPAAAPTKPNGIGMTLSNPGS